MVIDVDGKMGSVQGLQGRWAWGLLGGQRHRDEPFFAVTRLVFSSVWVFFGTGVILSCFGLSVLNDCCNIFSVLYNECISLAVFLSVNRAV